MKDDSEKHDIDTRCWHKTEANDIDTRQCLAQGKQWQWYIQ